MSAPSLPERADDAVRALADELVAVRRHVHAHPELSNREAGTATWVAGQLRAAGLDEVRTGLGGHGVVGVLRGGLPGDRVAALRADLDALPVAETSGVEFASTVVDAGYPGGPLPVSHACGHDCHVAVVLTAARALAAVRDVLPGTVLFVFQPAEEGPPIGERGGAAAMLEDGALADPEPTMVFGMHVEPLPRGVVGYRSGVQYAASALLRIVVAGEPVHASQPWLGLDPWPAAASVISGIGQLYRQVPADRTVVVTIGHAEDEGRFNVVGRTVTLLGTVRALGDADLALVRSRLERFVPAQAEAFGCTATVEFLQPVPAVVNRPEWVTALLPSIREVVGDERLVEVPPHMAYDDMSVFVDAFGGAFLLYGVQDTALTATGDLVALPGGRGLVPNHHGGFYADEASLVDAVRIHVRVAVDHLLGSAVPAPAGAAD